jgi:hypothetical protein
MEIDKSILEAQVKKAPNLGLEFTNLKDELKMKTRPCMHNNIKGEQNIQNGENPKASWITLIHHCIPDMPIIDKISQSYNFEEHCLSPFLQKQQAIENVIQGIILLKVQNPKKLPTFSVKIL